MDGLGGAFLTGHEPADLSDLAGTLLTAAMTETLQAIRSPVKIDLTGVSGHKPLFVNGRYDTQLGSGSGSGAGPEAGRGQDAGFNLLESIDVVTGAHAGFGPPPRKSTVYLQLLGYPDGELKEVYCGISAIKLGPQEVPAVLCCYSSPVSVVRFAHHRGRHPAAFAPLPLTPQDTSRRDAMVTSLRMLSESLRMKFGLWSRASRRTDRRAG